MIDLLQIQRILQKGAIVGINKLIEKVPGLERGIDKLFDRAAKKGLLTREGGAGISKFINRALEKGKLKIGKLALQKGTKAAERYVNRELNRLAAKKGSLMFGYEGGSGIDYPTQLPSRDLVLRRVGGGSGSGDEEENVYGFNRRARHTDWARRRRAGGNDDSNKRPRPWFGGRAGGDDNRRPPPWTGGRMNDY